MIAESKLSMGKKKTIEQLNFVQFRHYNWVMKKITRSFSDTCVSGSTKAKYEKGDNVFKSHTFKFDVYVLELN